MSDSDADAESPILYALRFQERAVRDINAIHVELAEVVSPTVAKEWRNGLRQAVASLATSPRRCALVPEKFRSETRHLLYRRSGSGTMYRIVFRITGEDASASDAPTVTILHIRYASARPITRAQIRQIEAGE